MLHPLRPRPIIPTRTGDVLIQPPIDIHYDESDPTQHELLHDGFNVKSAGNFLATLVAGRSVHATYPTIGGFLKFPEKDGIDEAIKKLKDIRPAVLRLIEIFKNAPFHFDRKTKYMALTPDENFGYMDGKIITSEGENYDTVFVFDQSIRVASMLSMIRCKTLHQQSTVLPRGTRSSTRP